MFYSLGQQEALIIYNLTWETFILDIKTNQKGIMSELWDGITFL